MLGVPKRFVAGIHRVNLAHAPILEANPIELKSQHCRCAVSPATPAADVALVEGH